MSELPILPLYTDAFIADTGHLSAAQTGAYMMLLMVAWRTPGCRLPDDDARLARWARVDARAWSKMKPVVMEFWAMSDGFWTQKRLTKERDRARNRADTARQNGAHGGRPNSLKKQNKENPAGSSRDTQQKASISISNNTPVVPKRGRVDADAAFEQFRSSYPKRDGGQDWQKARDRFARLLKGGEDPQAIIAAAQAYATAESRIVGTAYIKMAATFLSGSWKDYVAQASPPNPPGYPDWPENLPPPDRVRNAWANGHWPGTWGANPESPACRVPKAILDSWGASK